MGKLTFESNVLFPSFDPVPRFYTFSELGEDLSKQNQIMSDSLAAWLTDYENPGISFEDGYTLLPPTTEFENMAPYESQWFERVTYKGAFGSYNWIVGWTLLYESGLIND